jgi:hypothetical protein
MNAHEMKNLLFFFFLLPLNTWGQQREYNFSLAAGYNLISPTVRAAISDRYIITEGEGLDGYIVGAVANRKKGNTFWESHLSYLMNRSNLNAFNLKWQEDQELYGAAVLASGIGITTRMIRLTLNRGYFLKRWFSIEGGLVGIIQLNDKHYQHWPEELYYDFQKDMSKTIYAFGRSINRFMLSGEVAAAYHFGPLKCSLTWEKNMTPVKSGVEYHSVRYPVKYSYSMFIIGISYSLYSHKK